jgi:hypothetical protein
MRVEMSSTSDGNRLLVSRASYSICKKVDSVNTRDMGQ